MAYIYDLTDTWSAGGTAFNAIKMNVTDSASAAGSKLITLQTNGAEHFSVSKAGVGYFSGNVGIGISAPDVTLHAQSATGQIRVQNTTSGTALIGFRNSTTTDVPWVGTGGDDIRVTTQSTERMRITSAGNVGIGTPSPAALLDLKLASDARLLFQDGNTTNNAKINAVNNAVSANTNLEIAANNTLFFNGGSERARIDSSGNLLVGKTTPSAVTVGAELLNDGSIWTTMASASSSISTLNVYSTGAAAYRFYVAMNGTIYATSTSISAISDQRLKENVRDLDAGLDTILALKPRRFDWKAGKGKDVRDDMGFIAQEVEEVLPELIGDWKSGEGDPEDLKSVKAGDLIPVLVKAIQELTARVAQLEGN